MNILQEPKSRMTTNKYIVHHNAMKNNNKNNYHQNLKKMPFYKVLGVLMLTIAFLILSLNFKKQDARVQDYFE